jgi:hypothetical protein
MTRRSVLLAMPCAHGLVKMGAMTTMVDVALALQKAGYAVGTYAISVSDLVLARNRAASSALAKGHSHIFFVDSDMSFPAGLALSLLEADKDVVGLVYPRRELDLERLIAVSRANPKLPAKDVISRAQEYVVRLTERASFTDGLGLVSGLGMGATMIKTSALQTLVDEGRVRPRMEKTKWENPGDVWGFFDLYTKPDGFELSEDYSFCARWTERGGEIWGIAAPGVKHVGDFAFTGDLIAGKGQRREEPEGAA